MYECLSPSSDGETVEANAAKAIRCNGVQQRRSEGSVDASPDYVKFRGSFTRSTSLPYCGSETESEIYAPYSFHSSEDVSYIVHTAVSRFTMLSVDDPPHIISVSHIFISLFFFFYGWKLRLGFFCSSHFVIKEMGRLGGGESDCPENLRFVYDL